MMFLHLKGTGTGQMSSSAARIMLLMGKRISGQGPRGGVFNGGLL